MPSPLTPPAPPDDGRPPADPRTSPPRRIDHVVHIEAWARRFLVVALTAAGGLLVLDIVLNFLDVGTHRSVRRFVNLAREENLPTWFASTQAVAVGVVVFAIAGALRLRGASRRVLGAWTFIAVFFVFVGIDDAAKIHERLGQIAEDTVARNGGALPTFGWQLYVAPFFAATGIALLLFLWRAFRPSRLRTWLVAALACWATAVGLDFVEGIDGVFEGWAETLGWETYSVSHPWRVAEEMLEMVGTTFFGYAFLRYLAVAAAGIRLDLEGPPPPRPGTVA